MPVVFIGHGSPENALDKNEFTESWKRFAEAIPKPKAILCISAHWLKEGTAVTAMEKPKTIHDFYGFGDELYKIKYSAPGSKSFAEKIKKVIKTVSVNLDEEWGLDHGTWSVLLNMYPNADIPVAQLSLDYYLPLENIFQIGKELKKLRDEGVLIIGSGNIVHNLRVFEIDAKPYDWAIDFDKFVKVRLINKDYDALINYTKNKSASLAHPTNDHYLPLIYVMGAAEGEEAEFFCEKIIFGSISMRCVMYGAKKFKI